MNKAESAVMLVIRPTWALYQPMAIRDWTNMLSKMSSFVRPKSPISSNISSKFRIFVRI